MDGPRYGVISDVHGNLHALQSVLQHLRKTGADQIVCAGDLVGWGPQPNEVVEAVADADVLCVAGNHDLMAIGALGYGSLAARVQQTARWTREVLRQPAVDFLAALPLTCEREGLVMAHGSLDDPQRYIHRPEHAHRQLLDLDERFPSSHTLVLGHTHRQWLFPGPRSSAVRTGVWHPLGHTPRLINPGSVGQSRQQERRPRARCAVIDFGAGRVNFYALDYDVRSCRKLMRRLGLPSQGIHLRPQPVRRGLVRVRHRLQREWMARWATQRE